MTRGAERSQHPHNVKYDEHVRIRSNITPLTTNVRLPRHRLGAQPHATCHPTS